VAVRTTPPPDVSQCDAERARTAVGYPPTMTNSVDDAPDPDSEEFLTEQNPVEKVSPGTTADAPATDPELIPTDPGTSRATEG